MTEETMKVLQMIEEGKITAEEGAQLLESLRDQDEAKDMDADTGGTAENDAYGRSISRDERKRQAGRIRGKKLRIQVMDRDTGKVNVNLKIPLRLAKLADKFIPKDAKQEMRDQGIDLSEIIDNIGDDEDGTLVDVTDEEKGEHLRIYVE